MKKYRNKEGKLHRLDGPAIEYPSGSKEWYRDGKRHRVDGPSSEHVDGFKEWCRYDVLHRLDGPARIWPDGNKQYWVVGRILTEHDFKILSTKLIKELLCYR